jgi:hypothetical protein
MGRDVISGAPATWLGALRIVGSRLLLLKVMSVTTRVGCDFVISGLRREWAPLEAGGPCCSCDDWGCDMMTGSLLM